MSITIHQLISDAKELASRLKEREMTADTLLNETQSINKKIDEIRQYQEEVDVLNEVARHRPHSQLIASMQQDNRNFREIQQENRELRAALEDHQAVLEHIMSKYRQHTASLVRNTQQDYLPMHFNQDSEIIRKQSEKISEMAAVMRAASCCEDSHMINMEETLTRLITENKGLREMLEISCKYGSMGINDTLCNKKEDKDSQTDVIETDTNKKDQLI